MSRSFLLPLVFALAGSAVLESRLSGQVVVHVQAGDRIRLTSPHLAGEFTARAVRSDRIVLEAASGSAQLEIPIVSLTHLEVRRARPRLRGAKIGARIGMLTGAVPGAIWAYQEGDDWLFSRGEKAFIGGLMSGAAGVVVGALAGALFPGGRWEEVPVWSPPDVAPNREGGVDLSYEFRF